MNRRRLFLLGILVGVALFGSVAQLQEYDLPEGWNEIWTVCVDRCKPAPVKFLQVWPGSDTLYECACEVVA